MRNLHPEEFPLASYLFEAACINNDLEELRVESMDDVGMGSLAIDRPNTALKFGKCVAQCEFLDTDGVKVEAVLNCDTADRPMEIDIWKVNFAPLIHWPKRRDIRPLASASLKT